MNKFAAFLASMVFLILSVEALWADLERKSGDQALYEQHLEIIMNLVVNSKQFNEVYTKRDLVFKESELMLASTPVRIFRNGARVKVESQPKNDYMHLGELFFHLESIRAGKSAKGRAQIFHIQEKWFVNISLMYDDGIWSIDYFKKEKM